MQRSAVSRSRCRPTRPVKADAFRVLEALRQAHPEATCALRHENAFELVVATILSAQCTDRRVNEVTPALFRRYPTASALASATSAELEELIRSTGFFRAKARSLIGCAQALVREHGGEVPGSMAALVRLPGIGRKTANVVLCHAFGVSEGIAVDTHVLRVSNRLGLAHADDAEEVERQLMAALPRDLWALTSDVIIFHGRKVCAARRPACGHCPVFALCTWAEREAFAFDAPTAAAPDKQRKPRPRSAPARRRA
jgi:endonuclease III